MNISMNNYGNSNFKHNKQWLINAILIINDNKDEKQMRTWDIIG